MEGWYPAELMPGVYTESTQSSGAIGAQKHETPGT